MVTRPSAALLEMESDEELGIRLIESMLSRFV